MNLTHAVHIAHKIKRAIKIGAFALFIVFQIVLLVIFYRQITTPKQVIKIAPNDPNALVVNFAKQVNTGSPLVFGGVHTPILEDKDAWNLLENAGITNIRRDINLERELPSNITLEEFKSNYNNVQTANLWNKTQINRTNDLYRNIQKRNMRVIAILSYSPAWLTHSGTDKGVPKDWTVFENIVKKSYLSHRSNLDVIEIWNEPDIEEFLDISKSGRTRQEAYLLLFEHAIKAIKDADLEINDGRIIPILAPAAALPNNTDLINYILSNPISKYIDGISIHSYDKDEPSWDSYLKVMKKYGREKLPIYVTEWNITAKYIKDNEYISTFKAISYTGKKLIQFLRFGIEGANYFSMTLFNVLSKSKYDNSFGFYKKENGKSELLPQGKTWQLLSKSLGLGGGKSKIQEIKQPPQVETLGFTNYRGEPGVALVNESDFNFNVPVSLKNIKIPRNSQAKMFIASGSSDAKNPTCTQFLSNNLPNKSFLVKVPSHSVVGVLFAKPELTFDSFLADIGISTSTNCLVGL